MIDTNSEWSGTLTSLCRWTASVVCPRLLTDHRLRCADKRGMSTGMQTSAQRCVMVQLKSSVLLRWTAWKVYSCQKKHRDIVSVWKSYWRKHQGKRSLISAYIVTYDTFHTFSFVFGALNIPLEDFLLSWISWFKRHVQVSLSHFRVPSSCALLLRMKAICKPMSGWSEEMSNHPYTWSP